MEEHEREEEGQEKALTHQYHVKGSPINWHSKQTQKKEFKLIIKQIN